MWEERLLLKAEVKNCWIAQPSSYQLSLVLVSYLSRGDMFTLIFRFLASVPVELCISFLHFSLTRRSLVSHVCLLLHLPVFLHMVVESSWALWKMSLKGCQFYSAALSPRAVPWRIPSVNSFDDWKRTLKIWSPYSIPHPVCIHHDSEFHQGMTTAAQSATNLHILN